MTTAKVEKRTIGEAIETNGVVAEDEGRLNAVNAKFAGYIEKLPYRRPPASIESAVVNRVDEIVGRFADDSDADVSKLRDEIDELIFELFEIRASRDEIRRFSTGRSDAPKPQIRPRANRPRRVRGRPAVDARGAS